jgi:maltokinase
MKVLTELFREWMPHQRWFGGKGREWADVSEDGFFLDRGNPVLSVHRVRIEYTDGHRETYLVPLSWRDHPAEDLQSAFVGAVPNESGESYAYDAMRDRDATTPWLIHLVNASTIGPMHFHPTGVAYIPEGLPGDIVSGEQSNTSLIYGSEAILKLFRRLEPGLNPDVEIHDALRRTDNPHIAPLLGHIEIDDPDPATPPATVAMLQTFVPNASDGWRLATASVRDLYAEGDLHADEVGGDFAADSERLGAATASVHADMAAVLPTEPAGSDWYAAVAAQMASRPVRWPCGGSWTARCATSPGCCAASTTPPGTCWSSSRTTLSAPTGRRSGRPATGPRSAPATPPPAASTRAADHPSCGPSRPTRRCTSASTRHATARTG